LDEFVELLGLASPQVAEISKDLAKKANDLKITMLLRSNDGEWPDFAAVVRQRVGAGFRPLCASSEPEADALRMFCDRIASPGEERPNIGVIYLREAKELGRLIPEYESQENASGTGPLPVVIACAKGKVSSDEAWLQTRPHVLVKMPLPLRSFLGAVSELAG
ncbi:MAG: hypothetical protein ACYSVY_13070, partial [Planctomycetota bacterium]